MMDLIDRDDRYSGVDVVENKIFYQALYAK